MINSLVHTRDKKPVIYMIKYLANLVTKEELELNQISVEGTLPQKVPLMNYPKFEDDCRSLLKRHLTRENWSKMKKRATHLGGKIQLCIQCGVYNQKDKVGIYATDEEAYKVFNDIFDPVISSLHPEFDSKFSFKHDFELGGIKSFSESVLREASRVPLVRLEARRNFKDYPFVPMMSTEMKI